MGDLAKAADRYRKAQAGLEKARVDLERAIAEDGWAEAHRHISDGKTISLLYLRTGARRRNQA